MLENLNRLNDLNGLNVLNSLSNSKWGKLARIIHGSFESGVQGQTFRPQPTGQ